MVTQAEALEEIRKRKDSKLEGMLRNAQLKQSPEVSHTASVRPPNDLDTMEGRQAYLDGGDNAPSMGKVLKQAVGHIPFTKQIGAAAATVPAMLSDGGDLDELGNSSWGTTYNNILDTENLKQDQFAQDNPEADNMAAVLGFGASVPMAGGLVAKGAQALGKVGRGSLGLRKARQARGAPSGAAPSGAPYSGSGGLVPGVGGIPAGGKYIPTGARAGEVGAGAAAAAQVAPKLLSTEGAKTVAKGGALGGVLSGGEIEGAGVGAAATALLFRTPVGRAFTIFLGKRAGGSGKLTEAAWHTNNPQNRAAIMKLFKQFAQTWKGR